MLSKKLLMIKYYLFLLIVIILISIVQAILKSLSIEYSGSIIKSLHDPLSYLCIFLLVLALSFWFVAASKIEFSVLIPANIVTVVISGVIGYYIFSEEINLIKIVAYALIIMGVMTLAYQNLSGGSRTILDKNETISITNAK
jgi:multidrug transporter EmrE-like cation transporter